MSQLPKNFEKILLGVGGLAAVVFAGLGFMKSGAVSEDFNREVASSGQKDPTIAEAEQTDKALSSLQSNRVIGIAETGDGRPVDLFVGVPLFADKNNPNIPVDPIGGMKPVHPPIPNKWWIETGADMTFADSPSRDDDGDGFSNLEEFEGGSHPKDPKSIPPLIDKLGYVRDESTMWYVQFGLESGGKWAPRFTSLTPDKRKVTNRVNALNMLEPGDTFFADGAMAGRFTFTGMVQREVKSERTGLVMNVNFAQYEDLKANKKGEKYESQAGLPEAELENRAYYDRTAVLDLRAIGFQGKEFKVEERTKFALPPDAPEKNYLLKKVTPQSIEVEYTDPQGETKTLEISKG